MFSQLCRARQPWSPASEETCDLGLTGCRLVHCKFCDYRISCPGIANTQNLSWNAECAQYPDKVTENPAYGLSSKNWLEASEQDDATELPQIINMESPESGESSIPNFPLGNTASQQTCEDCDAPENNSQSHTMDLKARFPEETSGNEIHNSDFKSGKLSWSVLRHRPLSGDILKSCDSRTCNVPMEQSPNDRNNVQLESQDPKIKKNSRDKSFPLSLVRSIAKTEEKRVLDTLSKSHFNHVFAKNDFSRQRFALRTTREKLQHPKDEESIKRLSSDILDMNDPLSEIAQIRTEESVQEWLARIGESANSTWPEDLELKEEPQPPPRINSMDDEKERDNSLKHRLRHRRTESEDMFPGRGTAEMSRSREKPSRYEDPVSQTEDLDTTKVLRNASKSCPASVPMVVMQCSRLHSHIGGKPPFQQTSLPMGTLVTALYQESDWLYVQTPHGVEGFISAADCSAIGTVVREPDHATRRPWEPCDFPIKVRKPNFLRQQGTTFQLPAGGGKGQAPYVGTVKMKTTFYSDRYFSNTFKSKDSIKTAKTVTDILRSSPEMKVSNQ